MSKHRNLQHDYHNLITIASELVQTLASCINGEKITPIYLSSICTRLAAFKKQKSTKADEDLDEVTEYSEPIHQPIKAALPYTAPPIENNIVESYQSDVQARSESQSPVQEEYIKQVERTLPVARENNIGERLDYTSIKQELSVVDEGSAESKAVLLLAALGSVCSLYKLIPRLESSSICGQKASGLLVYPGRSTRYQLFEIDR